MDVPAPLMTVAVKATRSADSRELSRRLDELIAELPSLQIAAEPGAGQAVLGGQSELQLDQAVQLLRGADRLPLDVGAPQVVHRETITKPVETDYTHRTQTGGTGQFARVKIMFEPNAPGAGASFESKIVGGALPKEYISGIEQGIKSMTGTGVLAGFPVVDVKATLIDGAFHDVDSSVLAFEIASRAAFREALRDGGSVRLEPVMKVEVTTPEDDTGFVMSDLLARRGRIVRDAEQGNNKRGDAVVINAMVPLANMFGYVEQLRSGTRGRAHATMRYSHFQPVDPDGPPDPFRPAAAGRAA